VTVTHGLDDSRHRGDESAQAEATYLTGALNTKFPQPDYLVIPLLAFFIWILVDRARSAGTEVKIPKEIAR